MEDNNQQATPEPTKVAEPSSKVTETWQDDFTRKVGQNLIKHLMLRPALGGEDTPGVGVGNLLTDEGEGVKGPSERTATASFSSAAVKTLEVDPVCYSLARYIDSYIFYKLDTLTFNHSNTKAIRFAGDLHSCYWKKTVSLDRYLKCYLSYKVERDDHLIYVKYRLALQRDEKSHITHVAAQPF